MKEEEMQLVLVGGEGYKIEFKESLANIDKEIVAFANSSGGRIFLGITDGKKCVLRNPNIAGLLHRVKYIEKMGTGINKMRGLMAEAGLPPIVFEFGTFFTAIFRRPARIEPIVFDERGGVFGGINEKVAERMGKVIKALCGGQLNISQLTVMTGIPKRTLERDIALLKDKGFVAFEGAPKTGRYVLAEKGKKMIKELKG